MTTLSPTLYAALHQVNLGDLEAALGHVIEAEVAGDEPSLCLATRGAIAMRRHDWTEASELFERALALDPENIMLHMNHGMALFEKGDFLASAEAFRDVIRRDYSIGSAWHKLGACYMMRQEHPEGFACLERAVTIDPNNPECHHGMATLCSYLGEEEGALHHYRRAQELQPGYAHAQAGEAFTLLRMGRWAEGWPKFEARWHIPSPVSPWQYKGAPLYTGDLDGLRGKRVLLRSEQGFGDSIQFARYVPLVAEIAASVVVETQAELERLFQCLPAKIIVHRRDVVPEFDVQTSLMSLPLLFGTTPETVPPPLKYAVNMDRFVPPRTTGICWSGGPRPEDPAAHATDQRRSLDERRFAPIIQSVMGAGGNHVILQRDELRFVGVNDWQDTADIISKLDRVVTVDTAICHLAASLGVPTLMLSRYDACWRWGMKGSDTVWYPSMKIYRQPRLGWWEPAIAAVVKDLGA